MPTSMSMSQEHDASGLTPTLITIADDTTTPTPEDYHNYAHVAKQPHCFPHYSTDPVNATYYYPSSPETRISMSGSSTGSYAYSIPIQSPHRNGNWDSAVAMSSSPVPPPAAVLDAHTEASRAEAGFITDHYKTGINSGLSWSADGSLSDGGHGHGRKSPHGGVHDVLNTVAVYTTAEDKEGERNREPNAVLVLVSRIYSIMYMHTDVNSSSSLRQSHSFQSARPSTPSSPCYSSYSQPLSASVHQPPFSAPPHSQNSYANSSLQHCADTTDSLNPVRATTPPTTYPHHQIRQTPFRLQDLYSS